jgi:hypothetical protein
MLINNNKATYNLEGMLYSIRIFKLRIYVANSIKLYKISALIQMLQMNYIDKIHDDRQHKTFMKEWGLIHDISIVYIATN